MSVGKAGWRNHEPGEPWRSRMGRAKPSGDTSDRTCELYGWPGSRRIGSFSPSQVRDRG
jgi:hypothetical protein